MRATIEQYQKSIAAALSGIATLAAMFWPPVAEALSPEIIAAIGLLIGAAMVHGLPNRRAGVNVSEAAEAMALSYGDKGLAAAVLGARAAAAGADLAHDEVDAIRNLHASASRRAAVAVEATARARG